MIQAADSTCPENFQTPAGYAAFDKILFCHKEIPQKKHILVSDLVCAEREELFGLGEMFKNYSLDFL